MTDGTFSSFAGLLHFACIHSHALELFMLFFAFAYNEWAARHFQRKSVDYQDMSYLWWYHIYQLYFPEAERGLWRLQRRSNTRPNLGTARASGGLQQVLHIYILGKKYIFRKPSRSPSFLCLESALSVFVNNLSFIAVSARILLTSSHARVDLTATMLMWPMTARWAWTWKIWHISGRWQ